jgi:hypothetical protein
VVVRSPTRGEVDFVGGQDVPVPVAHPDAPVNRINGDGHGSLERDGRRSNLAIGGDMHHLLPGGVGDPGGAVERVGGDRDRCTQQELLLKLLARRVQVEQIARAEHPARAVGDIHRDHAGDIDVGDREVRGAAGAQMHHVALAAGAAATALHDPDAASGNGRQRLRRFQEGGGERGRYGVVGVLLR